MIEAMSRFQKIVIALLGVLVVAVIVGVVVVTQQQASAAAQADFERCMAIYGYTPEQLGDELGNVDLNAVMEASEACGR